MPEKEKEESVPVTVRVTLAIENVPDLTLGLLRRDLLTEASKYGEASINMAITDNRSTRVPLRLIQPSS